MNFLSKLGQVLALVVAILLALAAFGFLPGCANADPRRAQKIFDLKDEIATVASIALLNRDLTPAQRAKVLQDRDAANAHVDELTR